MGRDKEPQILKLASPLLNTRLEPLSSGMPRGLVPKTTRYNITEKMIFKDVSTDKKFLQQKRHKKHTYI